MTITSRDVLNQFKFTVFIIENFFYDISYNINTDIHTNTITHSYKYTHTYPSHMSISKKLDQLDLEIHEVDQRASHYRRDVTYH
jgi:hypothetical protein